MVMPATVLALSTLRLVATTKGGQGTGTGFLYSFKYKVGLASMETLALLTNKHVIREAVELTTTLSLLEKGHRGSISDNPADQKVTHRQSSIDISPSNVFLHPKPEVDLCAINITGLFNQLSQSNDLRHYSFGEDQIPSAKFRKILRPIEQVVMVGYPNGLWDEANNLPIIRRGQTASHPLINWNGKPEFVVDCACFPGSSGSPIFLYEDGMYRTEDGSYSPGTNSMLLGILYAGPMFSIEGKIIQKIIPTEVRDVPIFNSMLNLGFAISVDEIAPIRQLMNLPPASKQM